MVNPYGLLVLKIGKGGYVIWVRKCRSVVFPRRRTQKTHDVLKDDTAPVMSHRTVNKKSLIRSEL